jgi:phosphatidylinositol-3-phosphatase
VFSFENRTWNDVGMGFGRRTPYLHALGRQCSYFTDWRNANPRPDTLTEPVGHDSVAQYVAQITGMSSPSTFDNCYPSATCSTRANNLFRQTRRAGLSAVNYVEGAYTGCSSATNTATHVPALYLRGGADRFYCESQVRPLKEFNPAAPPAFAFITPSLCNDGHDCGNSVVDRWAHAHIQPVLQSRRYAEGKVAVFIWYDEDRPVPNMWIAPTARSGARHLVGAGYAGTLKAWESMLGLPCLANACTAPDMRTAANI